MKPLVKNFLPLKNELGIVLSVTPGVLRCLIVQRSRCFLRQTSCSPVCVPFPTGMFQISPSSTTVNGNLGQLTDSGQDFCDLREYEKAYVSSVKPSVGAKQKGQHSKHLLFKFDMASISLYLCLAML